MNVVFVLLIVQGMTQSCERSSHASLSTDGAYSAADLTQFLHVYAL